MRKLRFVPGYQTNINGKIGSNDEFIIVLAGGKIANRKFYYTKYNFDNYSFLPVGSKLLIKIWEHMLDDLNIDKTKAFFIIDNIKSKEKQLLKHVSEGLNIIFLDEKTSGVVETLYKGLVRLINEKKISPKDTIYIFPITTLITQEVFSQNHSDIQVYVSTENYQSKFGLKLSFVDEKDGELNFYTKSSKFKSGNIFTGILRLKAKDILDVFDHIVKKDDLLEIPKILYSSKRNLNMSIRKINFIDFGHEMNFQISKKKLINSRAFNSFSIDVTKQVFYKLSKDRRKIQREFEFYQSLPEELKYLFPCNSKLENIQNDIRLNMELLTYPTLGEIYLFHKISEDYVIGLFQKLYQILSLFRNYTTEVPKDKILEFYIHKTEYRIEKFAEQLLRRDQKLYETLIKSEYLTINDEIFQNFSKIKDRVISILDKNLDGNLTITHGDLCFSNILVDLSHNLIKLIDPRGYFIEGIKGIYGDPRYDIAKLLHSSIGKYENIMYGFYQLNYIHNKFELSIFEIDKLNTDIFEYYTKSLTKSFGYDLNLMMILVGLLFISMPPLHYEDSKRQIAQYINGIYILNKALEEKYR